MWSDPVNIVLAVLILSALIVGSLIILDSRLWRSPRRIGKKKQKRLVDAVTEDQTPAQKLAVKPGIVIDTGQAPRSQYGNRITEKEREAALKTIREGREL